MICEKIDTVYNIICFGFLPWSNMWKRNQSMMAEMAKFYFINRVIFVDPDISIWHILNKKRTNITGYTLSGFFLQKIHSKLIRYSPIHLLPYKFRIRSLEAFENKVNLRILRQLNEEKPYILFMNCPNILYPHPLNELAKTAEFSLFDFSDDFVELFSNKEKKDFVLANITKYARAADTVLTVNEHLKAKYSYLNKNIHVVKNATNYNNFNRKNYTKIPFLEKLKCTQNPIIGYTGICNVLRIDLNLLDFLVRNKPRWQFVFIGSKSDKFKEKFPHYKNLFHHPSVSYELLPDHLNYFDVAIVPFKINEHTKGNNLLKFHDYLAMGKPIVTTKIGGAEDFKNVVRIANTPKKFLDEIEKALMQNSSDLSQKRKKVASENSWPNRIKEVETIIINHLNIDHKGNFMDKFDRRYAKYHG